MTLPARAAGAREALPAVQPFTGAAVEGCTAAEAGSSDKLEYKINQGTENDSDDRGKQKCHYGPADTSCFLFYCEAGGRTGPVKK